MDATAEARRAQRNDIEFLLRVFVVDFCSSEFHCRIEFEPIKVEMRPTFPLSYFMQLSMRLGSRRPMNVTVLFGGPSAEREVSLVSGRAVAAALQELQGLCAFYKQLGAYPSGD